MMYPEHPDSVDRSEALSRSTGGVQCGARCWWMSWAARRVNPVQLAYNSPS
jgi:hypothetical protein